MNDTFRKHFEEEGFDEPTLIQEKTYLLLAEGRSVLGLAPTGSGKTLAYALPLLEKLLAGDGPQLLVIAPSQELAAQLAGVIRPWGSLLGLNTVSLIGGANVRRQIEKLRRERPEVVIGTPGRMLNLVDEKRLKLHNLEAVVIDEADEMLSQEETLEDCRRLVSCAPSDVQLAFFSATQTPVLGELHRWFGVNPVVVDVREQDRTQGHVTHFMVEVPQRKRVDALRRLANVDGFHALVFFAQNAELRDAFEKLSHAGVSVARLSGEQRQVERERALNGLKKRQISLVLTTDVACRGLDIALLPAVVNFDLPRDVNTYIHRVGRTGRMGAEGTVVNLGNEHDLRKFRQLIRDEGYDVRTGFIFNRQLTVEKDVQEAPAPRKKASGTSRKPAASRAEDRSAPVRKHRKNRRRDQKNKGRRKVKKA